MTQNKNTWEENLIPLLSSEDFINIRKKHDLSQKQSARYLGFKSRRNLSHVENGKGVLGQTSMCMRYFDLLVKNGLKNEVDEMLKEIEIST